MVVGVPDGRLVYCLRLPLVNWEPLDRMKRIVVKFVESTGEFDKASKNGELP